MFTSGGRRGAACFFSGRRRQTRFDCDWSSDVCSSDLVFFRGSPCAVWANWSGRLYGDTATMSMVVGPCGLREVTLQREGPGWVGTYRSQYPDEGTVEDRKSVV